MNGSLEEAYVAVERAYGQGDFARALQLADALRPQIQPGRADLLDHRLNLLIGHIHLYGLNQPAQAATAYAAVFKDCAEPSYRELASQGLAISRQQSPGQASGGASQAAASMAAAGAQAATPWMTQLPDPQQALRQIQDVGTSVAPDAAAETESSQAAAAVSAAAAEPSVAPPSERDNLPVAPTVPEAAAGTGADQDTIIPVVVTVEEEHTPEATVAEAPAESDDSHEPTPAAADTPAARTGLSEEEWADFQRGLLLVDLTSSTAPPSR